MILPHEFGNAFFPPTNNKPEDPIKNIIGIDSETYPDGTPFMFCTSNGDTFDLSKIPDIFFTEPKFIGANFFFYNMKFDSGATLFDLEKGKMLELWRENTVIDGHFRYKYIPHKALQITFLEHGEKSKNNPKVTFWDIAQFYHTSLDKAADYYLGERKIDIETKTFTPEYVKSNYAEIKKYCIRDAVLTKRLADKMLDTLEKFEIKPGSLYSCASIALKFFKNETQIINSRELWNTNKKFFEYGCEAYAGGKFECTKRGFFEQGFMYDIVSAYPYEMSKLIDLTNAIYKTNKQPNPNATYSFIRCKIFNPDGLPIPCGPKLKNGIRIFPAGSFYATITKAEFLWLTNRGFKINVFSSLDIFTASKRFPYKKPINFLFAEKARIKKYAHDDKMRYMLTKILMNSFYGKIVQTTPMPDGRKKLGEAFNAFYGAIITANTRIAVTDLQYTYPEDCIAIHTDSVIMTKPLPKKYLTTSEGLSSLGKWTFETSGPGLMVACGQYDIGKKHGTRSVRLDKEGYLNWQDFFKKNPNRKTIPIKQLHVTSWVEAMAKGLNHYNKINVFENVIKNIDLNVDSKRQWEKQLSGRDLLKKLHNSKPIYFNDKKPLHWD